MSRILRNGKIKTKTTRCSCCDNSNNLSKESLSHCSIKKKGTLSKHSLEARNEETKKTHTKGSSSDLKSLNMIKNKASSMKGKDHISNKKDEVRNRRITKSGAQKELNECSVHLIQLKNEEIKPIGIVIRREHKGEHSPETATADSKLLKDTKTSLEVHSEGSGSLKKLKSRKRLKHNNRRLEEINSEKKSNKFPINSSNIKYTTEDKPKECMGKLVQLKIEATREKKTKSGQSKQPPQPFIKVSGPSNGPKTSPKLPTQRSVSLRKLRCRKHLEHDDGRLEGIKHEKKSNKVPTSRSGNKSTTEKKTKECVVELVQLKIEDFKHVQETGEKQAKSGQSKQSPQTSTKVYGHSNDAKTSPQEPTQCSVSLRRLRSRKPVKYADSSLEVTKCEEKTNIKKVPIYKQNTGTEKSSKIKGDQYEFDSDTEKYKKRKRRDLHNSSSDKFNTTVRNVLKNIANKSLKKKKKVFFSDMIKKKKVTKPVLQNYCTINNNNQLKSKTDTIVNGGKGTVILKKTENINIFAGKNLTSNTKNKPYVINNINLTSTPKVDVNVPSKSYPTKIKQGLGNFTSVPQEPRYTDLEDMIDLPDATIHYSDSEEEYFVPSTSESYKSPKVKIISDIQLKARRELNLSIASPRMFKDGQPNANSTLLNNVLAPWRFNDINIQRNPHFIALKPSSLPYINQDMVLDHSIIDKLNETSNTAIENSPQQEYRKNNTKKSLMQATLKDYLKYNNENKENEENTKVSLFDSDQFSPIKNGSRVSSKCDGVKRRILGEINENVMEHPMAVQNLEESHVNESLNLGRTNEEQRYFGFDSIEEEDNEDVPDKEKNDRPFRLSININDKKYQRKRKFNINVKSIAGSDENSSASDDSDTESERGQIKLFEDLNNTQDLFEKQEEKTGMTKKLRNHKNLQKQKKRKDVRSEEEEEQAEKWAAAFNSMCEEIEQFPLEIE